MQDLSLVGPIKLAQVLGSSCFLGCHGLFCPTMAEVFVQKQLETLAHAKSTSAEILKNKIMQKAKQLTLATACSGTDSPVIWAHRMGMRHVFSCEFSDKKQKWILENFPDLEFLFKDIKTLKDKEVVNEVDGLRSRVAAADVFVTGFVCKSVSTENNNRHTYSNCIQEASGETGETFSGMMGYIKKHKPMVVIAENVRGITMRNKGSPPVIGQVVDEMRQAGYSFGWKILNTQDFLIPQNRPRCWMIGLRKDKFTKEDVDDCFEMIEDMKITKWSLSKYFKHFKVGKLGMPTRSLPNTREKRVIKAGKLKIKGRKALSKAERDNVVVDLAKSEARAPANGNATPCLVANSRMWWDQEERFLSAEEGMALQGIFPSDFPQLKSFLRTQSALCRDMTGNAFSMSVCTAVLNAVLLKVADHS